MALAAPAIGGAAGEVSTVVANHTPAEAPAVEPASVEAPEVPVPAEDADYSTCNAEDLATAAAEDPHPTLINHPSRFAPGCLQNSYVTKTGHLVGAQNVVDMGSRPGASGEVTLDADGAIVAYTVAANDAPIALGERFCTDFVRLLMFNSGDAPAWSHIDAGDVIRFHK